MKTKNFLLILIYIFLSCNTYEERKSDNKDMGNHNIGKQVTPEDIIDTLNRYQKFNHYETYFTETGWELSSYLYKGIIYGHNFSIKTNCNDGTVMVYTMKEGKWKIIDSIDQNIGWNFKTFFQKDIDKDKLKDIVLIDHDNYRRIVFLYNKEKGIIEHSARYDRLEK